MFRTSLFFVVVSLVLCSALGNQVKNVSSEVNVRNEAKRRIEDAPTIYNVNETSRESIENGSQNASSLINENDKPRDKRALGVILQGLAEAFGYTVSPISIAVLPNPNTTAATAAAAPPTVFTFPGIATPPPPPPAPPQRPNPPAQPPQRPQKPFPPTITTTMTPRQKETLRFTGVVNFGNNSDLLGHLRRYEQIFHGTATTTPAPPPPPPPRPPPTSGSTKLGLLPPFFVKIPLPIAPNLPPLLPPSAPRKIKQMSYKESYESGEITDEKDVRINPPHGYRDTYVDQPEWLKKERQQQNNKHREEDSSEESEENSGPNKYRQKPEHPPSQEEDEEEEEEEDDEKNNYREDEESNSYKKDERENDERRNEDEEDDEEDSREHHQTKKPLLIKYTQLPEDHERDNDAKDYESDEEEGEQESYKSNANNQDLRSLTNNFSNFDHSFDFVTESNPIVPKQFGTGLPIRVLDEPFNGPGAFRNSYGQSLEHDGRTDDSLADYFQRYKHPETGLYDSDKILNLEAQQRRELWWQNHPEIRRAAGNPLQQIRQEYAPNPRGKYEEYRLDDNEGKQKASRRQIARRKSHKEIPKNDEIAEPTVTTYSQGKAPKNVRRGRKEVIEDDKIAGPTVTTYSPVKAPKNIKKSRKKIIGDDEIAEPTVTTYSPVKAPKNIKKSRKGITVADEIAEPTVTTYSRVKAPTNIKKSRKKVIEDDEIAEPTVTTYSRVKAPTNIKKSRKKVIEDDEIAEPTVTTYSQVKAPKMMKKRNDHEDDVKEKRRRKSSKTRGNLKAVASKKISKIERNENGKALSSNNFDVARYNPYFRPLQVAYEPEKLQRTAERILSYHNFGKNGEIIDDKKVTTATNDDEREEENSDEKVQTKPEPGRSEKQTGDWPLKSQHPVHNAYVKPIQYVYKPETSEKTTDRLSSYKNEGQLKRKPEESHEDAREEAEEEEEEPEVRNSSNNSRGGDEESEVKGSPENLREVDDEPEVRGYPESLRKEENGEDKSEEYHSSENLKEQERDELEADNESPENLRDRESDENEPEVSRASKYNRRPEAEEEEGTGRDGSSERSKEAYYHEPEEYRSSGNSREGFSQEPENPPWEESPRNYNKRRPKVHRCSEDSEENCNDEANGHSENLRETENEDALVNRSSENSRENSSEEPEDERASEDVRENSDEEPEANRFSEKVQYYETPEVGLPERLTGKKLHEGESKDVQGWPAPFDYTFDSTESTKTLQVPNYSQIPYENVAPTHVAPTIYKQYLIRTSGDYYPPTNVSPIHGTPSIIELKVPNTAGNYYRDLTIAPTDQTSTYVIPPSHELPQNHQNHQNQPPNVTVYYENPELSFSQPLTVQNAAQQIQYPSFLYQPFLEHESRDQKSSDQSGVYVPEEVRDFLTKRQDESSPEPEETTHFNKADEGGRGIPRKRLPVGPKTFDGPESAHEFFGLSPDDYELEGQKFGQRKSEKKVQSPNTTPVTSNNDKLNERFVDKQEDPNYQRDVVLTEFTDEPESDTEKVRIKEYKNRVATIKVSEKKLVTPGGPVHLVGFTRNL